MPWAFFLSFTLSQSGMVRHWWKAVTGGATGARLRIMGIRRPGPRKLLSEAAHWKNRSVNGVGRRGDPRGTRGAGITKFLHGADRGRADPAVGGLFRDSQSLPMSPRSSRPTVWKSYPIGHEVIVPVSGIHRGVLRALQYAKRSRLSTSPRFTSMSMTSTQNFARSGAPGNGVELVVIASPYRSPARSAASSIAG
jgi:hypothetical protein